jgi:hypothetical protein
MMRKVGVLVGVVTLIATGLYTMVYLYRWEWNRALFTGMLFIAVEVGLLVSLVLRRLARLQQTIERSKSGPAVLARIQEAGPRRDHFAWLERSVSQMNVFVTVLLGAGVLLSAASWVVDRVASKTATDTLERGLVERLHPAQFPEVPLVPTDEELLAQGGPYGRESLNILIGPR